MSTPVPPPTHCFPHVPRLRSTGPMLPWGPKHPGGYSPASQIPRLLCPPLPHPAPGLWDCTPCCNLEPGPGPEPLGSSKPLPTRDEAPERPFPWQGSCGWQQQKGCLCFVSQAELARSQGCGSAPTKLPPLRLDKAGLNVEPRWGHHRHGVPQASPGQGGSPRLWGQPREADRAGCRGIRGF